MPLVIQHSTGRYCRTSVKAPTGNRPLSVTPARTRQYVVNNPRNLSDASGMSWWTDWGQNFLIVSLIGIAAAFSGGLAGALAVKTLGLTGHGAIAAGAATGALAGGLVGGALYALSGAGTFAQGFVFGAIIWGFAGGFAGHTMGKLNSPPNTNQLQIAGRFNPIDGARQLDFWDLLTRPANEIDFLLNDPSSIDWPTSCGGKERAAQEKQRDLGAYSAVLQQALLPWEEHWLT